MKRSLWLPLMAAAVIAVVLVRATADRDAPQLVAWPRCTGRATSATNAMSYSPTSVAHLIRARMVEGRGVKTTWRKNWRR